MTSRYNNFFGNPHKVSYENKEEFSERIDKNLSDAESLPFASIEIRSDFYLMLKLLEKDIRGILYIGDELKGNIQFFAKFIKLKSFNPDDIGHINYIKNTMEKGLLSKVEDVAYDMLMGDIPCNGQEYNLELYNSGKLFLLRIEYLRGKGEPKFEVLLENSTSSNPSL